MNIDRGPRHPRSEYSRRAGMIQMNVREQNGIQVRHAESMQRQLFPQILQSGAGARVDHRGKIIGTNQRGGDAPGFPGPIQVQHGGGNHRE